VTAQLQLNKYYYIIINTAGCKKGQEKSSLMISVIIRNRRQMIRVITPTRTRWDKHVACMGRRKFTQFFGAETCEKKTT
jgi:hypothetical protein